MHAPAQGCRHRMWGLRQGCIRQVGVGGYEVPSGIGADASYGNSYFAQRYRCKAQATKTYA
jgi:hypothetical protein